MGFWDVLSNIGGGFVKTLLSPLGEDIGNKAVKGMGLGPDDPAQPKTNVPIRQRAQPIGQRRPLIPLQMPPME